jgi:hypothetical protein
MTDPICQVCGQELIETPADADWPSGLWIWCTFDGTWGCATDTDEVHLHQPLHQPING